MPWWGWMIFGALLLGAELLGVDAAFYLVFIGLAAALTGIIELAGLSLEPWVQWIVFSMIALVLMFLFRKNLYSPSTSTSSPVFIHPSASNGLGAFR